MGGGEALLELEAHGVAFIAEGRLDADEDVAEGLAEDEEGTAIGLQATRRRPPLLLDFPQPLLTADMVVGAHPGMDVGVGTVAGGIAVDDGLAQHVDGLRHLDAYHATMPTDALTRLREVMVETEAYGFDTVRAEQIELGAKVRALFESRGIPSVAAEGFKAPGVVVSYTTDPDIHNSKKFLAEGLQTAAGVPLQCDEPADFMTFRVGLFGLEKWHHVDRTVAHLAAALDRLGIGAAEKVAVPA